MKIQATPRTFFTMLFLLMSVCILGACGSSTDPKTLERIAKSVGSVEEAKDFLTGTWTYTETEKIFYTQPNILVPALAVGNVWVKVVLKKDGVFELYQTPPTADNWGKPISTGSWKPDTGKYSDTGERWFSANITMSNDKESVFYFADDLLIREDGRLRLFQGEWGGNEVFIFFSKGDKFPFSK
jgi:hypothetical protein